jgi:hypothetical protein
MILVGSKESPERNWNKNNAIFLIHLEEWKEREHNTVDVNPVFIQF